MISTQEGEVCPLTTSCKLLHQVASALREIHSYLYTCKHCEQRLVMVSFISIAPKARVNCVYSAQVGEINYSLKTSKSSDR